MPQYTNSDGNVDLNDYQFVNEFPNGKTNKVCLWQHKTDNTLQIVVKTPHELDNNRVQHNIHSINAFFGADSAWPIVGEKGFAMKHYDGKPLTEQHEASLKNNKGPLRTHKKEKYSFTMLRSNLGDFLKLSTTGVIIPINHDYMIIHSGTGPLLPHQKAYLEEQMSHVRQMSFVFSNKTAAESVLDSYPAAAAAYLYEQWGKEYIKIGKYVKSLDLVIPETSKQDILQQEKKQLEAEYIAVIREKIALLEKGMASLQLKSADYSTAEDLKETLEGALKYYPTHHDKITFIENCQSAIASARLNLKVQTGLIKILDDLAKAIMNLFLSCKNESLNKNYSFFNKPSSHPLKEEIDGIEAAMTL